MICAPEMPQGGSTGLSHEHSPIGDAVRWLADQKLGTSRLISKHREMLNFALPILNDTKRPTKNDVTRNAAAWLQRLPSQDELQNLIRLLEESSNNSANLNELAILFQGGFRNLALSLPDAMDRAETFHKHGLSKSSAAAWSAAINEVSRKNNRSKFPRHKRFRKALANQESGFAWALAASKRLLELREVAETVKAKTDV